jgi:TRAP-type mannitol/chloroaromatic compound transport system substrate-binding protein
MNFTTLEEAQTYIDKNQKAIIAYEKQQQRMKKYQTENAEKCNEKAIKYYQKIKAEDPERYKTILQRRKERYVEKVTAS